MMRWLRFQSATLRDPAICRLSNRQYRKKFDAAFNGEINEFSPYLSGLFIRPCRSEWNELRVTVFERDNYTCTYCGAHGDKLECDHVVPVAKGGTHELSNLTTACGPCNSSKGAKLVKDWVR